MELREESRLLLVTFLDDLFNSYTIVDNASANTSVQNFMGIITKVKIEGKNKNNVEEKLDLIIKTAPQNPIIRSLVSVPELYRQEVYYYEKIFPGFKNLQKSLKTIFDPFPKFCKATLKNLNETLILKDMTSFGFQTHGNFTWLDYDHSILVIKHYAKLHALSYAMKVSNPSLFEELALNTTDKVFKLGEYTGLRKSKTEERGMKILQVLDNDENKNAYTKFKCFLQNIWPITQNSVKSEHAGDYAVLGHGDCWISNFLFKYAPDSHTPIDMCILDWQMSRYGSPALDLSNFFFCCLNQEFRRQHYDELLSVYYSTLSSFLNELGYDATSLLPYHILQDHLKKFSVYGVYMAMLTLYLVQLDDAKVPHFIKTSTEEDYHKWMKMKEGRVIDNYQKTIKGVVLDFLHFGYEFDLLI